MKKKFKKHILQFQSFSVNYQKMMKSWIIDISNKTFFNLA